MHLFSGIGSILGWIVAGLIFGLLAKAILPGKQNIPWWLTILSGIVGAFLGNLVAAAIGYQNANGGVPWFRWILDIVGAIVVVAIVSGVWAKSKSGSKGEPAAKS
ncbi:GlsB/YeaQ/YmgE family stress response membrane protein [Sciscionella marina]|uniref:GlsB/YeaQ/YmgE family stress response membrane protein n=1 Tax=Sciscionella marina TaxID=508770 RepID=UPI000369EC6C|nr:GlsB/YeaQ/YmgE family stress response membrane protein [Sciscionella marina]